MMQGEKPFVEKKDLFDGDMGGFKLYRIPGVVVTAKGTILAYCEARKNAPADYGEIETHLRRSTDGGKTWSKAMQIAHKGARYEKKGAEASKEQTVNNPVMIAGKDGVVHFLYALNYEQAYYCRSEDDGVTWSAPVNITVAFEGFKPGFNWDVIALGPGHGIQLKGGRLLMPIWMADGGPGKHGPSVAGTIYSDDNGKSWKAGGIAVPNEGEFRSPNESCVAELSDGSVMFNARSPSDANRRIVTTSADGVSGWKKPWFDQALWEPVCAGALTSNVPGKAGYVLFSNPRNLQLDEEGKEVVAGRGKRRNLTVQLSKDDGKTWVARRELAEGTSAYSDINVLPDGTIICFYERDFRLTFARFNLAWVEEGDERPSK